MRYQRFEARALDYIMKNTLYSKICLVPVNFYISLLIFATTALNLEGQRPSPNNNTDRQNDIVFISYAREDSVAAGRLYEDLKREGLNPWLDKESLNAGENWKIAINTAIKKSRYFIPILSKHSVEERGYVHKEFRYALDIFDEFPPSQIFVIPVRLDDCEIPYEKLKDIHYVDLFPDWNEGIKKILKATTKGGSHIVTNKPARIIADASATTGVHIPESGKKKGGRKKLKIFTAIISVIIAVVVILGIISYNVSAAVNQGYALISQRKYAEAIQYFDKALAINPNYKYALDGKAKALASIGAELYSVGRYTEAIQQFDKALDINQGWAGLPINLLILKGWAGLAGSNYTDATATFNKVLAINKSNTIQAIALTGKADALKDTGKYAESIQYYDKALALEPNEISALTGKADALGTLGKYIESIQYYDKALALEPNGKFALTGKGWTFYHLGNYADATATFNKALALDKNNKIALDGQGWTYYSLKNYTDALQYFNKALAIDPNYKDALAGQASALSKMRQ